MKKEGAVLGYVRASSPTQRDDLEKELVANYTKEKGYGEVQIISDVGSGLNEEKVPEALRNGSGRKASKLSSPMRLKRLETLRLFSAFRAEVEVISHGETRRSLLKTDNNSFPPRREALREP